MQDKDIDQLFGSGLQNFEVQPDERVWENIAYTINAGKRKKRMAWLSVAASLLVVAMAGVYFVKNHNSKEDKADQMISAVKSPIQKVIEVEQKQPVIAEAPAVDRTAIAAARFKIKHTNNQSRRVVKAALPIGEQSMAAPRGELLAAVVPGIETPIVEPAEFDDEDVQFKTRLNPAVQTPQKSMAAVAHKKPRIKTLGDLINVVVSKVDKRKDKLIEFTNTDGDEATITGINLGFMKIKKQD
ncbi:hypothetical protein FPZ43_14450 [Mucilaginibacter pallidiroseus]|uniref:Uncharacterized protein n=1 Tax=Mucilaginibacter pallidiroseus TaxID=2599295 RepID=A0A563U4W6_9SPHI|nr:hypothetical protein [Mucilaginibacter pallidiroseus]TWR26362.1 hypothetical protein FPZ43_14450 [Mucilaginibacter pallidiroseus]